MLKNIFSFFLTDPDKPIFTTDNNLIKKIYTHRRWSVFLSVTFGYGFYYLCRLSFSVVKKPLMEQNIINADQLGIIGSAFFITYAVGKFTNSFLADRLNIKKFISLGLLVSAFVHLILGASSGFYLFLFLWASNGWFQSFGAGPSVVSLSQWFSPKELGTYYGIWITSHNLGAIMTYMGTAYLIGLWGWRAGFLGPGIVCSLVAIALYIFMYDRPQTYGLPPVAEFKKDPLKASTKQSVWDVQKEVFKNPAVWALGLASACMYVARYAIESWGVVYLGAEKGYSTMMAAGIMSASQAAGLIGTVLSGFISDKFFNSRRNFIALICGIFYAVSFGLFLYLPQKNIWFDYANMIVFGFSLGVLLCYLGGLMAVDVCSKRAAGAAMGVIGLFSYVGAAIQELVSGHLIEANKTMIGEQAIYDFGPISIFWLTAATLSFIIAAMTWNAKKKG